MRSTVSLTEAIKLVAAERKLVATERVSLTDEVRNAAREGVDCTVISFRRNGLDGEHDIMRKARYPWGAAPGLGNRPARTPGIEREPGTQESEPAISGWAGTKPKQFDSDPIALGGANPLANPSIRFLAIGVRLAGIAILSFLSLLATPSVVGPDRQALAPAQETHLRSREAFEAWSATKDTTSITVLDAFVARYRDTHYAELALARIEELRKQVTPPLFSAPGATPSSSR